MSATICRVCNEKYPGPGHECPTEAQRERSPSSIAREADAVVSWLEDFMERDEYLHVGTRARLQEKIAVALLAGRRKALGEAEQIAAREFNTFNIAASAEYRDGWHAGTRSVCRELRAIMNGDST